MSVQKFTAAALLLPSLLFSTLVMPGFSIARAAVQDPECSTLTLVSGPNDSKTAGYTETDPVSAPGSLAPALYSGGALTPALATQAVIPPWIDPSTDPNFSTSSAVWVSSHATWPGGAANTEGSASSSQWRLFHHDFNLPASSSVTSAQLWYTADNATEAYLNGASVGTTNDVYGATPGGNPQYYAQVFNASLSPVEGSNSLDFVVRNWGGDYQSNPTGLVYKAVINYCVPAPVPPAPETVKVTIVKYMQGQVATASSSNSSDFPMSATWNAQNIGAGAGSYALGPNGFNSTSSYTAVTSDMTAGADYSTNEITGGEVVGAMCATGQPYALVGYSWGNSLAEAASSTPSLTAPAFTNLTSDKTVIVWNRDCSIPYNIKVHIQKHLDGVLATAASSSNYQFPMTATWQTANLNGGATSTGSYVLGNSHGGAADLYGADTAPMQAPAYYTTSEVTNGSSTNVLPIGATCQDGKYRLEGYRQSAVSFAAAAQASLSTSTPVFNGIESDQYVIVENTKCAGIVNGTSTDNGVLQVTGIDMVKSTSTADGTFEGGWKYVFHITDPTNEPNLAMKFADWVNNASTSTSTIPVANNMRISSAQANNGGATILLTAANAYSSPDLVMTGDLNGGLAGRQVDVVVEVRIPVGTGSGSYSTTYGVRSLP